MPIGKLSGSDRLARIEFIGSARGLGGGVTECDSGDWWAERIVGHRVERGKVQHFRGAGHFGRHAFLA